jgi:glycosyltransferase involved in cell wall biosynthesis
VDEIVARWRRRWHEPDKSWPASIPTAILRALLRRHSILAARYCDGTLVSNSLCGRFLIERLQVPPERVGVIPQAAPQDFLDEPAAPPTPQRHQRVLYVAQFAFFKAPRLVGEVFRALAVRFPQARFTWVCDRQHHEQARALLGDQTHRCELLPWVPQEELRRVYDEHGVFLFPSLFEGFGKAFLEAMARGLCVVASDEGGMHDLLRDGENGFLAPVGDRDHLVAGATRVLGDFTKFQEISRAARATALPFTWDRCACETVAFYEQLLRLSPTAAIPAGASC